MTARNFQSALTFVWAPGRDSPADGYHVTPNDPGGGTLGGVIEATWEAAAHRGLVTGQLRTATRDQLATILKDQYWGPVCDALPTGIDLLMFNGSMMSGGYHKIFQSCLGLMGDDVDGDIGPQTMAVAASAAPATLANALTGAHYTYLRALFAWPDFGKGWTTRLMAARVAALGMIRGGNPAA
jgi:lysozyme family protein